MSRTTVAIDANPAARAVRTGTETYAWEVARRLPAVTPELHYRFYAARAGDTPGLDLTVLPARRLWSQVRLPVELWQTRPDLFFAPSHVVPFAAPGRTVTVVHDLAFERHPAAYSTGELAYLRLTTHWAARRCRRLVAVSAATAADLVDLYRVPPQRISVVPLGGGEAPRHHSPAEASRRVRRLGLEAPFVLHVGRIEARKNQLTALAAVERLDGLLLACAGPIVEREMAARLASSPRCRLLGRVEQADLEALYARSQALLFPSLYEGFGLPVLEAMRRGVPVVTAAVSALPEVAGEAAVYVDDPLDAEALAAALERAFRERARLRRLGLDRAGRFSWDRTAEGVGTVIRELLE